MVDAASADKVQVAGQPAWTNLRIVHGYRDSPRPEPPSGSERLHFINMGAYRPEDVADRG